MKYSDLSSKTRSSYHWINFAAASLLVAALGGCGGGGGGDTTAAAPAAPAAPAAAAGAPVGTAVITAAAASPATTNTAANPGQAFGLITGVGASAITVASPPVVNFTVIDSTGKFVSGLALANTAAATSAAATAADPVCSGSNVTASIAKFDGANWQSLISRQRIPADASGHYSVAAGNPDPKPTAGGQTITKADGTKVTGQIVNADDAAAIADPTKRVVGVLKENTAGGYYTYYFATDVVTPLTLANAVDVQNLTQGKSANNGNVAVKDGKTVHRVGLQLCYVDPGSKAKVVVNPTYDFTLDTTGASTPVTAADGKTLARANAVIDVASCNECHEKLAAHGTRVDTNYCVICHNIGSKDYTTQAASGDVNAGSSVSLKSMIHKLHAGRTWLTKNYTINGLVFRAADASGNVTGGTEWPQDIRNCTKCHDNTKAAQADNWKNIPTRLACGSCHDGIDFTTGKGTTLNAVYAFHVGGAQADDSKCALCHDATTIPVYHETTIASTHNATVQSGVASFVYKLSKVTVDSSSFVNADFQILKDGVPVTFNANTATQMITGFSGAGPNIMTSYATGQDSIAAPSDWNSGHDAMNLSDAWKGVNGNSLTLKDAATSTYTAVVKASSAGRNPSHSMVLPPDAKMVTAILKDSWTQDNVTANAGAVPGIPAMMAASGNTPDGTANVARRVVFNESGCNTCHDRLGTAPFFHTGNYSIAMCQACHTPNTVDSSGWAASSKAWIHAIHGDSKRTVAYTPTGASVTDNFSLIVYPGVLKNCETCHLPGTYDYSASQYTAKDANGRTIVDNMLYVTAAKGTPAADFKAPQTGKVGSGTYAYGSTYGCGTTPSMSCGLTVGTGNFGVGPSWDYTTGKVKAYTTEGTNLVSSPIAAACTSCHDDVAALTHITTSGFGSFYAPRTTALGVKEQCLFCHGPGKILPIKDVHNPNWDTTASPIKQPW